MASRLGVPQIPRVAIELDLDPRRWLAAGRQAAAHPPRGVALRRLLWRLLWLPYWVGSDVPAPHLPARDTPPPAHLGLAGEQVARLLSRIARRVWIQRALTIIARGAWLGLIVGCLWLIVELLGGPALDVDVLIPIGIALALPSFALAALVRPTRRQVARMLDRSFRLQERMTTAVEDLGRDVPAQGERASIVYLQMADAANVIAELRRHPAFAIRPPVREIVLATAAGLLMAALYFLRGVGGDIPAPNVAAVPKFVPAAERYVEEQAAAAAELAADAPTTAEVEQRAQRSNEARRDLQTLARALDDHAVTRPAAEAMERDDYAAAANELRELSERADQLSPTAREGLAQDLQQAASQMSEGSQELSNAAQEAAEGLRQGEQAAQEGVRRLGDAVEQTGEEVASQQELAEQMRQARAAEESGQAGEQGSDQGQNAGEPGEQGQQGEPGEGRQGAEQAGEAGEGTDAEAGQADQSQQGEPGEPGDNQQAAGQQGEPGQSSQGQQGGEPGEGQQPGEQAGGQPGEANQSGEPGENAQQGPPSEGEEAQQGGGAGSDSAEGAPEGEQSAGADQQPGGEGEPAAEQVTEGQDPTGAGQQAAGDPRDAVALSRAPEGESVRTGGDSGSSSLGSGAGVTVSGGSSVQGEVGQAGPDSNRVPPAYRTVVEAYFSDPEGDS